MNKFNNTRNVNVREQAGVPSYSEDKIIPEMVLNFCSSWKYKASSLKTSKEMVNTLLNYGSLNQKQLVTH